MLPNPLVIYEDLNKYLAGKIVVLETRVPRPIAGHHASWAAWTHSNLRSRAPVSLKYETDSILIREACQDASLVDLLPCLSSGSPASFRPIVRVKFLMRSNAKSALSPPVLSQVGNLGTTESAHLANVFTQVLSDDCLDSALTHHVHNICGTIMAWLKFDKRSALLHFLPELSPSQTIGLVSVLYPPAGDATELSFRSCLHKQLGLPLNYPRFLRTMNIARSTSRSSLESIHLMLPQLSGFLVYMVHGTYTYHHYGSGLNDSVRHIHVLPRTLTYQRFSF
jgi:hypothetical protein